MADNTRKEGINEQTGLPHEMSLAEVFDNIRLAPTEIATLLTHMGASFHGGPQQPLAIKLQNAAAELVNPDTYSNKPMRDDIDPRDLDAQGREVTPRRSDAYVADVPPSFQSLNPGGLSQPTAVPMDEPAHPAYAQSGPRAEDATRSQAVDERSQPRTIDAGAENPNVQPTSLDVRGPQVAEPGADNPRVAVDRPASDPNVPSSY